ncbi:MAG: mechanosensitive ion channel [Bacteroidaceae bacterium]|jgi:small conductance mechanosensitive channel|nr:mechanosensitive ion channel [Bacteroidaceae bacterium]MBR4856716.1 mechanosensitive ion channel [Bacteroidaceae bacterium]MBR4930877.1 mechanosensitive ion channel [Bacteroidaceae bacterium]MBR5482363.1 mechanosensitive ion channel [Bacteroidaceae bacterium]
MFSFLSIEGAAEQTAEIVKNVQNVNLEQVIQQVITFCVDAGKSILLAAVIFIAGRFLISVINRLVAQMMERRKIDATIQSFLRSFINILLTILLLISVVSALGVNTTSFAALLASAGVAVGMALSGNLQNLAGGLIILLFKPYKVGDYVDAQGVSGTVKEIQIFHTVLVTPDNKIIYVPNGSLSSGSVTNYSLSQLRRVDWTVGVEYGTEIEKVRQTVLDLIKKDGRILTEPAPFIALSALADSSVNITIRVWVKNEDYWGVFFDMNQNIYEVFNREGISFPFPQVTVHQA